MNPSFFGPEGRRLFGIYHPPQSTITRDTVVVLCYPGPEEWMRAHWAYRQLASLTSRVGYHVFRFDYFGTGDSQGKGTDGDLAQWQRDVTLAAQEACSIAGVRRVSLVGARLGAALAANVAANHKDDHWTIQDVVLWDPVISGEAYLTELRHLHGLVLSQSRQAIHRGTDKQQPELLGVPFSPTAAAAYASLNLKNLGQLHGRRLRLITTEASNEYTQLAERLAASHADTRHIVQRDAGAWSSHVILEQALLPAVLRRTITEQLTAGAE